MENKLIKIASEFNLDTQIEEVEPLGEGFINDTYVVNTAGDSNYILQQKNKNIFKNIPGMMDNIEKVTTHLKEKIIKSDGDPFRESLTVIKTNEGNLFYQDENGDFWAMCLLIDDHVAYTEANSPELAYAGGKGIGKFQRMMSDFKGSLVDTLPGFHDIKFRFKQWDEVLSKDPIGRRIELNEEIQWIESRRKEMEDFWKLIEDGSIPKRITHNDTKISNILFDNSNNVLCVIDLDTVLNSTALNDFGDAIRSYTNTGLEDDENLENVNMDLQIFKSFAEGYLSEAYSFLQKQELEYLAFSARFITYEQVLRFLMDYIDGDNYYKTKSPEHNLIRARAQYKLLQSIEDQMPEMSKIIGQIVKK